MRLPVKPCVCCPGSVFPFNPENTVFLPLVHRRIFGECLKVFGLSLSVLLILILMGRALQLRDMLFGLELGLKDTLLLFAYLAPFFFQFVMPVACMLAVFITFLRMSTDRELVALHAGGIGLLRLMPAPVVFGLFCFGVTLWVSLYVLSWGMDNFRSTVMEIAGNRARIVVQAGVFNQDVPGLVFYARNVDPVKGTLAQVIVEDSSRSEARLTILAPSGTLSTDNNKAELIFLLKDGRVYAEQGNSISVLNFEEYIIRLRYDALFEGFSLEPLRPREMSFAQLMDFTVEELLLSNPTLAYKVQVEKHKRFMFPFACIVLALLAVPLATAFKGLQQQSGVLLALGMFFLYYGVVSLGITLGESGSLSPLWGMWLPNAFFFLVACFALYFANQERMPQVMELWRSLRAGHAGKKHSPKEKGGGA